MPWNLGYFFGTVLRNKRRFLKIWLSSENVLFTILSLLTQRVSPKIASRRPDSIKNVCPSGVAANKKQGVSSKTFLTYAGIIEFTSTVVEIPVRICRYEHDKRTRWYIFCCFKDSCSYANGKAAHVAEKCGSFWNFAWKFSFPASLFTRQVKWTKL